LYIDGNFDTARVELKACLKLDPENHKAAHVLKRIKKLEDLKEEANGLFNSSRYESAIRVYMTAVEVDSLTKYNSILFSNMAASYMRIGKFKEALDYCTKSLEKNPSNIKALGRRIECQFKLEDYHSVIIDLEKLRRLDPSQELECTRRMHQAEMELNKQPKQDYYTILGVTRDASQSQIKTRYKKLALELHPDKYQGRPAEQRAAEYKFKLVVEAYGVLSDPDAKYKYDQEQFPPAYSSFPFTSSYSGSTQGHRQYEGFKCNESRHQKDRFGFGYKQQNPWF
jgi:DnaJ homolog subfamily C member 7